jgi:hypothetical protein
MADEVPLRWDTPGVTWDSGFRWDQTFPAGGEPNFSEKPTLSTTHNHMEYWEITKARAIQTLPVWTQHLTTTTIGVFTSATLSGLIAGFEPLVQARVAKQDFYDKAFRAAQKSLGTMRVLGVKVAAMIDSQLTENESIMKDLADVYRVQPRDEASVLSRLRVLLPLWVRANTALAALGAGIAPIVRAVGGVAYTAAAAQALLDGYTQLTNDISHELSQLNEARASLRAHDRECDQLNKRFYQYAKAVSDEGSALENALGGITTEPSTPVPETVEIDSIAQGGEQGVQALVDYVDGGGDHATEKSVYYKVEGVNAEFVKAELDFSGNALGPFAVGQVVKIYTEVANSAGRRTTAVRTITITEPIV